MATRIPPLHALTAFEAAARLGSFARAAEELCLTRSAISHRIQLLEQQLGMPLFERHGRALKLTAKGQTYLVTVRQALDSLQQLSAPSSGHATAARVTISSPPTFARVVLLPRLQDFAQRHPEVELALNLAIPLLDLNAGDADVEIRYGSGSYPDMESRRILDEPVFPVANPSYLERCGGVAAPVDLQKASLLRSTLEPWKPWFTAAGLPWNEPRSGPRFEDLALLYQSAVEGQGVALARHTLVRAMLDSGDLVSLFDVKARSPYAYYLVYDKRATDRPGVAAFVAWMESTMALLTQAAPATHV
jgi:LysR family transcriptional regulator, glycine cleavage system transcriptional activator